MARPPKPPGEARTRTIRFRVTEEDEAVFVTAAAMQRPQRELSQWIRETLWAEAKRLGVTKGAPSPSPERPSSSRQRVR